MSRKRKSAPPRRLDVAAREEHNWETGKDDTAPILAPAAQAENDDLLVTHTEKTPVAVTDGNQEPSDEDNHRTQEKQFKKTLDKLQAMYEHDFPRATKKPRKTIHPSFTIPFNNTKGGKSGGEDYVELSNITIICDRHNEEFFSSINEDTHHLYSRFVAAGTPHCDFVKEDGEVLATAELPLPQPVIDSLFFLQKRGIAYLDAFPVIDGTNFSILLTPTNLRLCVSWEILFGKFLKIGASKNQNGLSTNRHQIFCQRTGTKYSAAG